MDIGIWGDSITYGAGDSEGLGWVGRMRRNFFSDSVSVYNRGVCGDTSEDLLSRFTVEAESIEPDKIIFAVGINDSKFPAGHATNKVPLEEFKKHVSLLVDSARKHTDSIFILGLTRVDEEANLSPSQFSNEEIGKYDSFLREFSGSEKLHFIDVYKLLSPNDLIDGLHPNAQGYEKMTEVVLKGIQ